MEYAGFGTLISRDLDLSFPVPDKFFKKYKNSDQIEKALFKIMRKGLVELTFPGSGLEDDDKTIIDTYLQAALSGRRILSRKKEIALVAGEIREIKAQLKSLKK